MELTLADQAITLTLTQLPDILSVQITVRGQELAYRSKQVFTARDVLVAPEGDVVGTAEVTLYFPDESGVLQPEERTLELYEGDTQVSAGRWKMVPWTVIWRLRFPRGSVPEVFGWRKTFAMSIYPLACWEICRKTRRWTWRWRH